jgi:hypothetical protein
MVAIRLLHLPSEMVGHAGFEPAVSSSQTKRDSQITLMTDFDQRINGARITT